MNDTSASMDEKMREIIRKKTPQERIKMGCSMYATSKYLIERKILEDNPLISRNELKKEVFLKFYGMDFSPEKCNRIVDHLLHH